MKRVIVVVALLAAPLLADEVILRGGGRVTGQIVKISDESVTVDVGGGTLTVPTSSVVHIEGGISPLQEYRERAKSLPDNDAAGWRELARWADRHSLATMADEAWAKVVAVLPNDSEANTALGKVEYGGAWVTEEQAYRAQGYVEFEGEWMTPAEQQAILQDRRTRDQAYYQAQMERVNAEKKDKKEQEARDAAETEKFMHGGLPQYSSDVVYWGWGASPSGWPSPVQQGGSK